ncbi:protein bunched, class 2/F/G isoform [Ochlerotatus camptorhynchus]|uniref:protein bunched, class 2/F/G isoform n=1 Tax=Ochlerotatus camptorhynchus TaxID=644619 RepID=UPI0031E3481B
MQQQLQSSTVVPHQQHGHRRIDSISSIDLVRYWPGTPPDLYNITLSAMKQYIRSQLNSTGLGKGPRKRSHHHSDADIDFYQKIIEFNNTQSTFSSNYLGYGSNKSSVSNVTHHHPPRLGDTLQPGISMDVPGFPEQDLHIDDPMASFERSVEHSNDQDAANVANAEDSKNRASATTNAKDYSIQNDDPREYMAGISPYPERPAKTTTWDSAFVRHREYVYFLLSFSLIGAVVLGLFGAYRCLRVTASRAPPEVLALPIQFITDDLAAAAAAAAATAAPLSADSNHLSVPMLSVQSPGCAGMERLGVPARSSIGSPPLRDERSRRLRVDPGVASNGATSNSSAIYQHHPNVHHHSHTALHHHDHLIVSSSTSNFMNNHHNHHAQQYHQTTTSGIRQKDATGGSTSSGGGGGSSSSSSYGKANHHLHHQSSSSFYGGNNNLCSTSISRCPHHVALPDGERGPDRDLQIRSSCQQSEIPRTYVKAPPNKTVRDVPAQYQSGASSTSSSMSNLNSHLRGGVGGSVAMSHSLSGGVSLGNRAIVNSLSALGGGNGSSSTGGNSTSGSSSNSSSKPKSDKLKEILRSLTGNKTSKSSTSGINISSSSSNNNYNNNNGTISSSSSCNNNNYRSNPYGNGSVVGSSGSRSGLGSSNGGNHLAVSGIHNHNHHYRQSTASVQQRQHQQTQQSGLSSSVPNASSGSSLGGSNTPMSLSASPSPDTSTHYM